MPKMGLAKGHGYVDYNFDGDPNWIKGSLYGTGLDYSSSPDPMYDAYYKANPYVGQTYNKTWIDKAFGGLFRTGYDKWLQEMQLNAAQYDAGVVDMMQQNQYNSEASQAARMRAAGENPDLLGTGDVESAATMQPDTQDAQIPDAVDLSSVASFASMIGSCFSGSFAMVKQGIDIVGAMSEIRGNDIDNSAKMQDLALRLIRQRIPAEGFSSDADYLSWLESLHTDPNLRFSQSLAKEVGLKRGDRRMFEDAINHGIGSLPATLELYKDSNELVDSKVENARKTSSKFYDESMDVMKGVNNILVSDSDALQELIAKNTRMMAEVGTQQAENAAHEAAIQDQYLDYAADHAFGRSQAQIEGEGYNITKLQQSIDKCLKKTRQSILNYLEKCASEGNDFATYMIHNMMLHEYMNFEFKAKGELGIGRHLPKSMQGWIPSAGADMEFGASM